MAVGALVVFLVGGCGCSETGIGGDTDVDGDAPPEDVLWDPPIENLGEPGWRESSAPHCREDTGDYDSYGVWSDERGVFVSAPIVEAMSDTTILMNDGSGWRTLIARTEDSDARGTVARMRGIPNAEIFGWEGGGGSLGSFDETASAVTYVDIQVNDVWVVNEHLVYAVLAGDPRLIVFDGSTWGPFPGEPLPYEVHDVWADETSIFLAGGSGIMLSLEEDHWIVHDTRTMAYFTALWGFSGTDVWAATGTGELLHWDGVSWENIAWPNLADDFDDCRSSSMPILGIWGTDAVFFFHTYNQFVMWDGEGFYTLGYWPGVQTDRDGIWFCAGSIVIRSIWGNSENEVFLAVEESEIERNACEEYLLWWDGSEFHWF
jgi:hypothetical protein